MTETRRKEPTMTLDATQQARLDGLLRAADPTTPEPWTQAMRDQAFALVAREDVPWLVALVTDLAAQVDTLTAEVERLVTAWDNVQSYEPCRDCLRSGVALITATSDAQMDAVVDGARAALDAASPTPHTPTKEHQ